MVLNSCNPFLGFSFERFETFEKFELGIHKLQLVLISTFLHFVMRFQKWATNSKEKKKLFLRSFLS